MPQEHESVFRNKFSSDIWQFKYNQGRFESWWHLSNRLCHDVCGGLMPEDDILDLVEYMARMKWLPGGRYIYYAGRNKRFWNNCFLYRSLEDTREDWANTFRKIGAALMTGGGIGNDYSVYRAAKSPISGTGGEASGPIPAMQVVNDLGRQVMQGGSRRSAMYASLNWRHGDIKTFLKVKDWHKMPIPGTSKTLWDAKVADFNFPAPMDMTNISVNYDTKWVEGYGKTGDVGEVFLENAEQALRTGEPGFSFNFWDKENETLRNAPVSGNTKVMLSDGYVRIADIVDEEVVVWTGKRWAKTTFRKTKENAPTVKIIYQGNRSIVADPEHPFFVERQQGFGKRAKFVVEKVPAGLLKVGDTLVSELPTSEPAELHGMYYTLGFVWGDGSFNKYGSEVTLADPAKFVCQNNFDPNLIKKQSVTQEGYRRFYLNLKSEVGKTVMPLLGNTRYRASFLAGIFDADGSYDDKHKTVRFSSSDYNCITHVREYLEYLGIRSSISKPTIPQWGVRPNWTLTILREDTSRFAQMIPTARLKVEPHKVYRKSKIRVLAVENSAPEDVFCCNVGVEEHSFCAEGVIISNCCELTSEDDSDVCNLASLNMARIESLEEFVAVSELVTKFQICATMKAELPHDEVYKTREKNRRLGQGLMGMHEWLLKKGLRYEMNPELAMWLGSWKYTTDKVAAEFADSLGISRPVGRRAIAPTGSIAILAGTTGGIEPLFAVAYKRRYLKEGTKWHYQYVVDSVAEELVHQGVDPDMIETALDLARDPERRIRFQADVQDYVDHAISSTINLPAWGSAHNNEDKVKGFAQTLAKYAHRLRGFTCYPDGSRGGQPLSVVSYSEAKNLLGNEFEEHVQTNDVCEIGGKGGSCGA